MGLVNGQGEWRTGPQCFGTPPGAKQSNALLILITEMILIRTVAKPSASHPRTARGRMLKALRLSLLKAPSPVGPFDLSVFNYMKWIPWERKKRGGTEGWGWRYCKMKAHKREKRGGEAVLARSIPVVPCTVNSCAYPICFLFV